MYQNYNPSYNQNPQNPQTAFQQMSNINPRNLNPKVKNNIVNQNIYHAGYGNYKVCPVQASVKFPYKNTYNPGTINVVGKVLVQHKHAIDVADSLCDHGLDSLTAVKPIPAIMYPVGKDFVGSNFESREGIYDENVILRTNYPYVIQKQHELFSRAKEDEKFVVYSNPITVIRDSNYNAHQYSNVFKIGLITLKYHRQNELLADSNKSDKSKDTIKMLYSSDMLYLQMYLENVFQAALCGFHDVLLLPILGQEFEIPIEDQIKVYNMCIMKFSHKFKAIIICIPPYESKDLFEFIDKEIVKPQNLIKDVDMKYVAKNMSKQLESDESDQEQSQDMQAKILMMNDSDKMKMLKKIVKKKRSR